MFSNVSWPMYLSVMAAVLFAYYLYVGVRYYGFELKTLVKPRGNSKPQVKDPVRNSSYVADDNYDQLYENVEHLGESLRVCISEHALAGESKENLLAKLKQLFKPYKHLKNSPFRQALSELILAESNRYGAVLIAIDDLDEVWEVS